ncbi:MAG TPA: nitrilase-related carbon-nitrogen hydrolase [Candidatus Methanofastidiosa archaeon]|nr:nitrilase-related carbon-nitrogen hydrolase [Candidatus Methanofastidiosa archaeon]
MKIGYIQTKPVFLDREENLDHAAKLLEKAAEADIMVLPELFNTGYNFQSASQLEPLAEDARNGVTSTLLQDIARDNDQYIAAGYAERKGDKIYNAQLLVGPGGFISSYRKVHLFFNEKRFFAPGQGFEVIDLGEARIGQMVCFDWFFPESMRTLMLKGADIVLHSANLVLPYCPNSMVTRCLENRVFAVTCNRIGEEFGLGFIGMSQITGTDGTILHRAPEDKEEVWIEEINQYRSRDKDMNELNNIIKDRATDSYELS